MTTLRDVLALDKEVEHQRTLFGAREGFMDEYLRRYTAIGKAICDFVGVSLEAASDLPHETDVGPEAERLLRELRQWIANVAPTEQKVTPIRREDMQLRFNVGVSYAAEFQILSIVKFLSPNNRPPFQKFWKPSHELKFCTSKYEEGARNGEQFITAAETPSSHRNLYMNSWAVVDAGRLIMEVVHRKIIIYHDSDTFFQLKGREDRATTLKLLEKAIRESPHLTDWTIEDPA